MALLLQINSLIEEKQQYADTQTQLEATIGQLQQDRRKQLVLMVFFARRFYIVVKLLSNRNKILFINKLQLSA